MVNPINALVRGSVRFINTKIPVSPRTTFNLGQVEGGTSVNSIPHEAKLKVDLRSESEDELVRLESALRDCIATGVKDETDNARDRSKGKLDWKVEMIGSRPGGELTADSALLASLRAADDYLGNQSRIERSSTDANIRCPWALKQSRSARAATAAARILCRNGMNRPDVNLGLQRAC